MQKYFGLQESLHHGLECPAPKVPDSTGPAFSCAALALRLAWAAEGGRQTKQEDVALN